MLACGHASHLSKFGRKIGERKEDAFKKRNLKRNNFNIFKQNQNREVKFKRLSVI